MSLEEYIRKNKEDLKLETANPDLWSRIEGELSEKEAVGDAPLQLRGSKLLLLIVGCLIIGSVLTYAIVQNKRQNDLLQETRQEVFAMRSTMEELLVDGSSFKRVKAVNISQALEYADPDIIETLIYTLRNDQSPKVQLAAVNALERFADREDVRVALIEELVDSDDPFLQVKIIKIMGTMKDDRLLPILNNMAADEAIEEYIIEEANAAIKSIQAI